MSKAQAFSAAEFARLGECCDERQSVTALAPRIDRLLYLVNRLPTSRRIAAFRETWAKKSVVPALFATVPSEIPTTFMAATLTGIFIIAAIGGSRSSTSGCSVHRPAGNTCGLGWASV